MKKKIIVLGFAAGILANIIISCFILYRIDEILSLNDAEIPSLYSMDYFLKNDCSNYSKEQLFNMPINEYIVYFYGNSCSSCAVSNEYLASFIYYGFINKVDVFFVNVADRDDLLTDEETSQLNAEEFKVVYTPTMLVFNNGNIKEYVGSDEVYEALDEYVKK